MNWCFKTLKDNTLTLNNRNIIFFDLYYSIIFNPLTTLISFLDIVLPGIMTISWEY